MREVGTRLKTEKLRRSTCALNMAPNCEALRWLKNDVVRHEASPSGGEARRAVKILLRNKSESHAAWFGRLVRVSGCGKVGESERLCLVARTVIVAARLTLALPQLARRIQTISPRHDEAFLGRRRLHAVLRRCSSNNWSCLHFRRFPYAVHGISSVIARRP